MSDKRTSLYKKLSEARSRIPSCQPPFWANGGHLQTLFGHLLFSPRLELPGVSYHVDLGPKNQIHSTYLKGTSATVVYLFHGLGGSSQASYMQRTALIAQELGHHVFLNNHRGCGEGVGLATEPYHSGRAEDLSAVIGYGKENFPDYLHVAIGFSLSANALLLLSAGVRASIKPDVAIAVNGPINLERASIKLSQGFSRIYDLRFVIELKRYVELNHPEVSDKMDGIIDLRQFDAVYTAPMGGFENREEYYRKCSAAQYLSKIDIPTILLTAQDDPFVGSIDYTEARLSESTILHMEKYGGHMGYLSKKGNGYSRWLDTALKEYLQSISYYRL
jgi:uncharacterized protein